ncbi:class I SAM-dependent DNA methyltransferase [Chloroflexota bacterium]
MKNRYGGYEEREFIAEYYDCVYETHVRKYKDVNLFIDYSRKANGKTLELGCGTGRVLIPTAIAGYEITGLDLSPYMLDKCREKLNLQPKEVQQRVRLVEGNMTNFDMGETYKLITIPFRAFQHLISIEEQKGCLENAHRHIDSDGILILDVFRPLFSRLEPYPEFVAERTDAPDTALPDGRKLHRTSRTVGFHPELQYNDIEIIYYVTHLDGKIERLVQSFPMRYYFRYEMEHLLNICGFRVINLFGDFDSSKFTGYSPEMIFVAEKI